MSGTRILCAGVALVAFSLTATAQTYVRDVQTVPKADELDDVVRAQYIKPGDVSPEEYAKLLEEAEKVKAFQGSQTYAPSTTYGYVEPSTTTTYSYVEPTTTYSTSSTTEYVYDGRPNVSTTASNGYQIELYETPVAAPVTQTSSITGSHTVVKGDTLYNISKRYNVSLSDLRSTNGISGNNIGLGQVLTVPSARRSVTENVYSAAPTTLVRNVEPIPNRGVYAVLPGDTLYGIARRACVNVSDITGANSILRAGTIHPGQRLNLPAGHCLQ